MPLIVEYCMVMCENDTSALLHISASFEAFLYFYYKKTTKCDRLNVFIITFATLIKNKSRNKDYDEVLSTYSHIHVYHDP